MILAWSVHDKDHMNHEIEQQWPTPWRCVISKWFLGVTQDIFYKIYFTRVQELQYGWLKFYFKLLFLNLLLVESLTGCQLQYKHRLMFRPIFSGISIQVGHLFHYDVRDVSGTKDSFNFNVEIQQSSTLRGKAILTRKRPRRGIQRYFMCWKWLQGLPETLGNLSRLASIGFMNAWIYSYFWEEGGERDRDRERQRETETERQRILEHFTPS